MKNRIYILLILYTIIQPAGAQQSSLNQYTLVNFKNYLELVRTNNLEYASATYNVDISEAEIESAKIFDNPELSIIYSSDREAGKVTGYSYTSGLGITLDIFGKRGARIDMAKSGFDFQKATLNDFFRNLQADAALAFLEALKQHRLYRVRYDSYITMKQLSEADSTRYKLGIIMEIDAMQSKLEAGILHNDLIHARAQFENAILNLNMMTGKSFSDTIWFPDGTMECITKEFNPEELIKTALSGRSDLIAAQNSIELSRNYLGLVRKERRTDVDLSLEMGNNYLIAPGTPRATTIAAGLGIPLKLSNIYKGDIKSAEFMLKQSETDLKNTELKIEMEITQAWQLYDAFSKQVESFDMGLLQNATNVKNGKIYSYQRGETSLLEVLDAQRTYNEIQTAYYEALYNKLAALIELEKSAGIWDITF